MNELIRMEDFNGLNAKIEIGLTSNKAAAEAEAAEIRAIANSAKVTANAAKAEAEACSYVVGSYTGTGEALLDIEVGFKPSFLIICRSQLSYTINFAGVGVVVASRQITSNRIFMTDSGFRIHTTDGEENPYPAANVKGLDYDFIAFR